MPVERGGESSRIGLFDPADQQQSGDTDDQTRHDYDTRDQNCAREGEDHGHGRDPASQFERRAPHDPDTAVRGRESEDLHGRYGANRILDVVHRAADQHHRRHQADAKEEDEQDGKAVGFHHVSHRLLRALSSDERRRIRRQRSAADLQRLADQASLEHHRDVRGLHESDGLQRGGHEQRRDSGDDGNKSALRQSGCSKGASICRSESKCTIYEGLQFQFMLIITVFVQVFGRSIRITLTRSRWFDIPLTREESLQADKKLTITFGPSQDPEGVIMVDSIKMLVRLQCYMVYDLWKFVLNFTCFIKIRQD